MAGAAVGDPGGGRGVPGVDVLPGGEDLLYNWPFIACAVAVSVLAGISLLRPDPLRLFRDDDELVRV
ncbi:hypothetical protein ACFQV2_19320 [Actinokineospora soli]|uniref:Uncharacterized protein n=1 Tax=Actinokineospora soli TaxID=1048753 RepID=A0ABW2TRD4_9PSEU